MSRFLEILSEKNEKCVVYAVLRDVTGIAGFCLQSVLQKCLRSRPHIYWREPHLGKCGGVMLIEEVFVFLFLLGLHKSGNFDAGNKKAHLFGGLFLLGGF